MLPIVAAVVVVVAAPAGAIAGNGGKCTASACKVYVEPGANRSGHHQSQQHQAGPSTTGEKGGNQPAPTKVDRVLAAVGKDKGALSRLLGDSSQTGVGAAGTVASPSALGAIFDLGSGPNVLLAFLIATVLGLTVYSGVRSWRSRRASA